jgi:hypothetical protein
VPLVAEQEAAELPVVYIAPEGPVAEEEEVPVVAPQQEEQAAAAAADGEAPAMQGRKRTFADGDYEEDNLLPRKKKQKLPTVSCRAPLPVWLLIGDGLAHEQSLLCED